MNLEKELSWFSRERDRWKEQEHFKDALVYSSYNSIIDILDDIILDLPKEENKEKLLLKYRNLYKFLGDRSIEYTDKRFKEYKQTNHFLPPGQKLDVPQASNEETYLSECLKYIFSMKYALEERQDGWNKIEE